MGVGPLSNPRMPVAKLPLARFVVAILALSATLAHGQAVEMRVGVSGDLDRFHFGVHTETGKVAERQQFRQNIEVGVCSSATLFALDFEFCLFDLTKAYGLELVRRGRAGLEPRSEEAGHESQRRVQ